MFGFLFDKHNYEQRKVARFEQHDIIVSTAAVSDGSQPYETGVYHPRYNDGKCIIVEAYDTIEEARIAHVKWVAVFTNKKLPKTVVDVPNAYIARMLGPLIVTAQEPTTIHERKD